MLITEEVESMLMKLAQLDNKNIEYDIEKCCLDNNAHFVPILKNRFGILTEDLQIIPSASNSINESDIDLKTFVDVYKCATDIVKRRRFLLWVDKSYSPYNGKILDNLFFKRVIKFCIHNNIFISYIKIISKYKTENVIEEAQDIQDLITQKDDFIIEKMKIELENRSIIFDKVGYVDIASNFLFFQKNEDIIRKMLTAGLEE